jgi:tetratricopeptide (TPR) repeat protein/CHAT domain-containing protein
MTRQRPEQEIDELNEQVVQLYGQGKYKEALEPARQVCELARRVLGDEHPDTATFLNNLGTLLRGIGDLAAARSYLEQGLEICRRVLGDDHPDTATSVNNLGMLLQDMGDFGAARPYCERALEINRRVLGDDHPETATSATNLGLLLQATGNLAAAQPYYEQALEINRRVLGDDHPNTATCLNNLGFLLEAMGNLATARVYFEQALEIHRRVLGDDHPDTARSLNNLGALLNDMADWGSARPYYEQALEIRRRVLGDDHPDTARSLNNLGALLLAWGDRATARPYLEQGLNVRRRVLGNDHPDTAQSLGNLGYLLNALGDLAGARSDYEEALEIRRRVLGNDHPDTASSLNSLGAQLRQMGDLAAARPYLEQGLEICRRVLGNDHPDTATCLYNLAALEIASGRIADPVALMWQASTIDDLMVGQVFSIGSDQQRLFFLRTLRGNQEIFLSLVSRHLSGSPETVRSAFDLVLRRKALAAEALAVQRDTILGGRYPQLREAFDQLTQLRQRTAQKMLAGPAPRETLVAHEQTLHQWRQEQQQRETTLARQIPDMNLEQQLQKADRRAVALALPEGVALVEFVRFHVFDFHAVPARGEQPWQPGRYLAFVLPAGQPEQVQMIDLGEADPIDQMIADFRASITTPPWQRPRGQKSWSESDESSGDPQTPAPVASPPMGTELRQRVFDPLRPALGEHTQLWLSPDGDLARLPFEVLPDHERGELLLDTYRLSYLATGRDVLRCGQPATRQPAPAVVAADPDFDLIARSAYPASPAPSSSSGRLHRPQPGRSRDAVRARPIGRLPGTRAEGERIAALLGVQPLLDTVLDQPLKALRSPRILHLATHGFFLEDQHLDPAPGWRDLGAIDRLAGARFENPMLRSGLLLAGFNTWRNGGEPPAAAEDGMLTAEDVTGMDLLDTELVVLSACETGLGQVHVGEGVFGLRRAFAVAGARTLVMSLWKVPDEQTQELMVDFYQRILRGEPRAEALRQAQQAVRIRHPDPYYWGAFICQGDPGPLRT